MDYNACPVGQSVEDAEIQAQLAYEKRINLEEYDPVDDCTNALRAFSYALPPPTHTHMPTAPSTELIPYVCVWPFQVLHILPQVQLGCSLLQYLPELMRGTQQQQHNSLSSHLTRHQHPPPPQQNVFIACNVDQGSSCDGFEGVGPAPDCTGAASALFHRTLLVLTLAAGVVAAVAQSIM